MSAKAHRTAMAPAAATRTRSSTRASSSGIRARFPKRKAQFAKAVKLDPKIADAHYWLGMALVNQGKLPEAKAPFTGVPEARADRASTPTPPRRFSRTIK